MRGGAKIGKGTFFYAPNHMIFDETAPYLINIGKNVMISENVTILTHGYEWSVLKGKYCEVLGNQAPVFIGNNVFIGLGATILKGVSIGDNVIIGAESVVTTNIPNNCVAAGIPAKVICTIDDYYDKKKGQQLEEAFNIYCCYRNRFNRNPNEYVFREYFWLFTNNEDISEFTFVNSLQNNYEETIKKFKNHVPMFKCYDDFINYCDARYIKKSENKQN